MIRPASGSLTPPSSARSGALPSALARVYARAVERYQEKRMAEGPTPEPDSRNAAPVKDEGEMTM
jgi:hypothetical protein